MTPEDKAIKEVLTPPENYWGALDDWCAAGYGPTFAKHRDSDVLDISNYETILSVFREKYEFGRDFVTETSNHWAVGWIEQIVVRVFDCKCGDDVVQEREVHEGPVQGAWMCITCDTDELKTSEIFKHVLKYHAQLMDYPVVDEEDYSRREYEEVCEYLAQEVGEEHVEALYRYLFDKHSVSHIDDIRGEWIEEWKKAYALATVGHNTLKCRWCDTIYDTSAVDIQDYVPPVGDGCKYCTEEEEWN
jgi:hypothetical protein